MVPFKRPGKPNQRRFISLKWRIASFMSVGVVVIGLSFFYVDYSNLKEYSANQRAALNARSDQEFKGLLEREGNDLQRVGEFIPALPGIRAALAAGDAQALQSLFEDFWPTLEMDIQVEAVQFFDARRQLLASFESPFLGAALPAMSQSLVHQVAEREQPLATIICADSCGYYVLIPVLSEGRMIGAVMLANAIGKLLRSFAQLSGNDVGLLLHGRGSDPERALAPWFSRVTALTEPADNLPLLREMAALHPQFPENGESLTLRTERGTFEARLRPILNADRLVVAHLISISDISAHTRVIDSALWAGLLVLVALLVFAELGLLLLLKRPMARLATTTRSLPLLAERRYVAVRQAISLRSHEHAEDEIDVLNRSTLALSDALEDLEAQVQARNHDLADKVLELAQERERFELAARGANDGLWDWNLEDDRVFFSPRWVEMSGYQDDQVEPGPEAWFNRIYPDDLTHFCNTLDTHLSGASSHFECEYRLLQADQSFRWMLARAIAVTDSKGHPYRIVGSQTDIHERKNAQQQLQHDALHDALTRLPNRLLFMDRLKQALSDAQRHDNTLFAVLYIDLDRFKVINDSLGHAAGDQLLVAVAQRFKHIVRPGDTVARMGGDEFAIIINDLEHKAPLYEILGRLQEAVVRPIQVDGREVSTSMSTGIAFHRPDYRSADDILRDADTAMYYAKKRGSNRYAEFNASMHAHVLTLMKVQAELKQALRRDELVLHYQPIVDLASGRATGFEALVRWNHPQRGLLPPVEFLPVAEEAELMGQLGDWVLESVCSQIKRWKQELDGRHPFTLNINLDANHLMCPEFPDQLIDVTERYGIEPHWIKIEITENMLLDNSEQAIAVLNRVRDIGFHICLDDFGTGYSSLSYLRRLPIDTLKIDRSFISNLDSPERDQSIVRAIITLAHSLGMEVVAEGIETPAQQQALRDLGCDSGQGFLFAKGLDVKSVMDFLHKEG